MWEQSDTTVPWGEGSANARVLPCLEGTFGSPGSPWLGQPTGRRGPGGSRSPRAPARSRRSTAGVQESRGRGRAGEGARRAPYLSSQGGGAGRAAGSSGGARAGRASVGTARIAATAAALGTQAAAAAAAARAAAAGALARPGSNILRRLEHARLKQHHFSKATLPVPEGKDILLLF